MKEGNGGAGDKMGALASSWAGPMRGSGFNPVAPVVGVLVGVWVSCWKWTPFWSVLLVV